MRVHGVRKGVVHMRCVQASMWFVCGYVVRACTGMVNTCRVEEICERAEYTRLEFFRTFFGIRRIIFSFFARVGHQNKKR